MKYFLLFIFLPIQSLDAQLHSYKLKDYGVYLSDSDFVKSCLTKAFDNGEGLKMKEDKNVGIKIKTHDTVYTYYADDIWGYRENGIDWRLSNGKSYRIDYYNKAICIYTIPGSSVPFTPDWSYFSAGLTDPIHELSRKNLKIVFRTDKLFVNRIDDLPEIKSIFKWDKIKRRYLFIDWLSKSNKTNP